MAKFGEDTLTNEHFDRILEQKVAKATQQLAAAVMIQNDLQFLVIDNETIKQSVKEKVKTKLTPEGLQFTREIKR